MPNMLNQYHKTNKQLQHSEAANNTEKNHMNYTNLCQAKRNLQGNMEVIHNP